MEMDVDARKTWRASISMNIETASRQLDALGNATRLRIYRTLVRAGESGAPVGRVQDTLGLPASTLSHHLKKLLDVGLIRQERSGNTLHCHAEYPAMKALVGFLVDECCADEDATGK